MPAGVGGSHSTGIHGIVLNLSLETIPGMGVWFGIGLVPGRATGKSVATELNY